MGKDSTHIPCQVAVGHTLKKGMERKKKVLECKNPLKCNEIQPMGATKRVTLQFKCKTKLCQFFVGDLSDVRTHS